jgi:hypothetical protein
MELPLVIAAAIVVEGGQGVRIDLGVVRGFREVSVRMT